jgi:hypothetical protein
MTKDHRRPMRLVIATCVFLLSVACGPIFRSAPPSAAWQSTVDELSALQSGLEFPKHFADENAVRTGEEFDIGAYFSVLDHLSMEPRYMLDYVYCYDEMGGYPRLYARPEDQPGYVACGDFRGARDDYLAHVQTDGTEEGFFQFVLLHVVGGQFYLLWHANYYDDTVVCDRDTVDAIVSADDGFGEPFSREQKRAARAIVPAPVVEMGDETVTVEIVTFSKWGGFSRETYEIDRSFPHTILDSEFEVLVEYDCGIMF